MTIDYRLLRNPGTWKPTFLEKDLFNLQTTWLKCFSYVSIDFTPYVSARLSNILNRMHLAFQIICLLHIVIISVVELYLHHSDESMEYLTYRLTLTIVGLFSMYSLVYMRLNSHRYDALVEFMNTKFLHRSAYGVTCVTGEPSFLLAKRFAFYWTIMCLMATLQWVFVALIIGGRALPINFNYDRLFDRSMFYHRVIFVVHMFNQIYTAGAFSIVTNVMFSAVVIICGQFDILFCSLKNLRSTAMTLNTKYMNELRKLQNEYDPELEEVNQYRFSSEVRDTLRDNHIACQKAKTHQPHQRNEHSNAANNIRSAELELELSMALRDCVRHHYDLVQVSEMLEEYFSPFNITKSLQVTFMLCNVAFTVYNSAGGTILQYINVGEYMAMNLLDIYLNCYLGDNLKQQSVRLIDSLMRCPWHLCGPKFRKDILIVMANGTRPLTLTGGKFFVLDFNKMIGILKAAFSYFTLLQAIGGQT